MIRWLILLTTLLGAAEYRVALPGYVYQFPRDHFSHPEFQTEWWYWTGNLTAQDGRRFGFELTFFRHNVRPFDAANIEKWDVRDVYMAHLALTDVNGKRFYHDEKINRAGPGLAGVDAAQERVWNGNWSASLKPDSHRLQATTSELQFDLRLRVAKPPVTHGVNGVSQKAPGPGKASHYISFPRLEGDGTLTWQGDRYRVSGQAWMDHEFFTNQLGSEQAGWDWFCIQLENNEELMLYRLRLKNGAGDQTSSGTFIDSSGKATHLTAADFRLQPGRCWQSKETGGCYPTRWEIEVPKLALRLQAAPALEGQELVSKRKVGPSYWEGAMNYEGTRGNRPIRGLGYLELTGYSEPFSFEKQGR